MATLKMPDTKLQPRRDRVLASLEPDQLASTKHHFSRCSLKGRQVLLLWSLRIYLLLMIFVVIYQMWAGAR
jgi:hypothetical protein